MFKNNLEALEIKNKALADKIAGIKPDAVSYTHLTLPTILRV